MREDFQSSIIVFKVHFFIRTNQAYHFNNQGGPLKPLLEVEVLPNQVIDQKNDIVKGIDRL